MNVFKQMWITRAIQLIGVLCILTFMSSCGSGKKNTPSSLASSAVSLSVSSAISISTSSISISSLSSRSSSALSQNSSSSAAANLGLGKQLYSDQGCLACHGPDGLQRSQPIQFNNYSRDALTSKIEQSMPPGGACKGACAQNVADYLWSIRPQAACQEEQPLPKRLRLLTKFEYINTVSDLFGKANVEYLATHVGSDTEVDGYDTNVGANLVTMGRMDAYWTTAELIAKNVPLTSRINACSGQDLAVCFVEKTGRDIFRRPLTTQEKTDYAALFKQGKTNDESARYVVQALLASSNFLYRTELGVNGQLTPYEVANLLSYTFWGTMPDTSLFTKAQNNQLTTVDQLKSTVNLMLNNAKARKQFAHFGRQWLHIEPIVSLARDTVQFPKFNYSVAMAMDSELDLFLPEILLTSGYSMADFYLANFVFANDLLADFYNLPSVESSALTKVTANSERGGVLLTGAVLARNAKFSETNPIQRGLLVRSRLLCQTFGAPPPNVGLVEPFNPDLPTRQRFAQHSNNATCANCHQHIDEVGFAFEQYDAAGQYRTLEVNGVPIDAAGKITGLNRLTDTDSHAFNDLKQLSSILAKDGFMASSSCVAQQFQRMSEGLQKIDTCRLGNTMARWNPKTQSLRDLWLEIVVAQTFIQRQ